jgi:hypothetical protein
LIRLFVVSFVLVHVIATVLQMDSNYYPNLYRSR